MNVRQNTSDSVAGVIHASPCKRNGNGGTTMPHYYVLHTQVELFTNK